MWRRWVCRPVACAADTLGAPCTFAKCIKLRHAQHAVAACPAGRLRGFMLFTGHVAHVRVFEVTHTANVPLTITVKKGKRVLETLTVAPGELGTPPCLPCPAQT